MEGPLKKISAEDELSPVTKRWIVKVLILFLALLILQIPLHMVSALAGKRQASNEAAAREVSANWGGELVAGDISRGGIFPELLEVKSSISPEIRRRGIYQTAVYTSRSVIRAEFPEPAVGEGAEKAGEIAFAFSDLNGLRDVSASVNGKPAEFRVKDGRIIVPAAASGKAVCELTVDFRGSTSFAVTAVGKRNRFIIAGGWPAPNFAAGSVLPDSREVDNEGFRAEWNINNFSGMEVKDGPFPSAGVGLHISAGTYLQVERTITYATFFLIVFFFTIVAGELLTKTVIHPLQYLVSAGAPVLFYLMLLALGERTGFGCGYLISAAVIVCMTTAYAGMFLRRTLPALAMGAVFAAGYALNYFILQMEEYALLSGTVVLAIILGVLMLLTGRLNEEKND